METKSVVEVGDWLKENNFPTDVIETFQSKYNYIVNRRRFTADIRFLESWHLQTSLGQYFKHTLVIGSSVGVG